MRSKSKISVAVKGLIVGGTMLVPGVSGGSMAMILGIYQRLIFSVSSFARHKKENFCFLGLFATGAGIGMVLFAQPLAALIERYPKPMLYFFLGAVGGGIPVIYRESRAEEMTWRLAAFVMAGWAIVVALRFLPAEVYFSGAESGWMQSAVLIATGVVAAAALVLPGISISYLFLMMGLYEKLIRAIGTMELSFLLPLAFGLILGIFLVTRVLELAMTKRPNETYLMILGFVIASLIETFPGMPQGAEWLICVPMAGLGYFLMRWLSQYEERRRGYL